MKLLGKRIGVTFGGYVPLHEGHLELINRMRRETDSCFVVVGGADTPDERGALIGLPVGKRYELVKQYFADDPKVYVLECNETKLGIPKYPNGWDVWMRYHQKVFRELAPDAITFVWYFGEPGHEANLEQRFDRSKNNETVYVERVNPTNGTKIRENPAKYMDKIALPFRKFFA